MVNDDGEGGGRSWGTKRVRRLRPEIAAARAARGRAGRLKELYQKPVTELSPTDLSLMKAEFFRE